MCVEFLGKSDVRFRNDSIWNNERLTDTTSGKNIVGRSQTQMPLKKHG